jgi:hypothetical protein
VGTGIIYAAIVVAWAAYLLPLVRHHREQPSATRPNSAAGPVRVLGKRSSAARARGSEQAEPSEPVGDDPPGLEVPAGVDVSPRRYDAAARRRRVLCLILATAVVIGVFAFVGMVPWWSLAVPGGLLVVFVVLARLSVRAARATRRRVRNRPPLDSQAADMNVADEPTSRRARRPATAATAATPGILSAEELTDDPAAAWVAHSPVDAWDPLPVTLPTYVTKDAAPARRVRTIDLSGAAAFSAGRLPEAELLSRQPETVEELGADGSRSEDGGASQAATG